MSESICSLLQSCLLLLLFRSSHEQIQPSCPFPTFHSHCFLWLSQKSNPYFFYIHTLSPKYDVPCSAQQNITLLSGCEGVTFTFISLLEALGSSRLPLLPLQLENLVYYNRLKNSKIVISDFHLAKLENGLIKEPCGTPEYLGKK